MGGENQAGHRKDQAPSPSAKASFAVGIVEDAYAHTGAYRVRLPGDTLVSATDIVSAGCVPMGARPLSGYPVGSTVFLAMLPSLGHAVILGALPRPMADANLILPDSMVLRSRAGICEEPMHYSVFQDPQTSIGNYSAGRAADCLPGDWGFTNDFGLAFFIGRIMASIRASDLAKVEAFWGDDLLRLTGYNMQIYTAGREEERFNDEGEYNEVVLATPFPWEGLGFGGGPGNASIQVDGKLSPGQENAKYEPHMRDQQIIPRHVVLRGYLGDLEREYIAVPPAGLSLETSTDRTLYNGVLEINKGANGAYAVRSAKEITFEKYVIIPVPKRMFSPDDPLGTTRRNYRAAGQQGSGDAHELPEFKWGDETDPGVRAAQLYDYHGWLFSRYTMPGLHFQDQADGDWAVPEESELSELSDTVLYDKSLRTRHKFRADMPSFGELVIDQRPGHTARYYKSRSLIKQLDDGSVLLEGGYGEQILLSGGNIEITCPGDVWTRPGRNIVNWAPHDFIARAGNSADITAAKRDVRIKAERNLHCLAGNSGIGGLLLESRAEGPESANDFKDKTGEAILGHGVTIKAANSSFHVTANDIHIGRNQTNVGKFTLDAGDRGTMYLRGNDVLMRTLNILAVLQASSTSEADKEVFAINKQAMMVSTQMQVGGNVSMFSLEENGQANLFIGGGIVAHGGALFDESVITNGGFLNRQSPNAVVMDKDIEILPNEEDVRSLMNQQVDQLAEVISGVEDISVTNELLSPGNEEFQRQIGFSCRDTEADLKLEESSFIIYESRWQQIMRNRGETQQWDEPAVKDPTETKDTRPHPGQKAWEEWGSTYGEVENDVNFELSGGNSRAKARANMDETGKLPTKNKLNTNYLINVQE